MGETGLTTILADALPYVARFRGKSIVVKLGGSALGTHDTTIDDVALCQKLGIRVILVHGGGSSISGWLRRLAIQPKFASGLRITDDETLDVVIMTLAGQVNKGLVLDLQRRGVSALGICGIDGALLQARVREPALGRVGDVFKVDLSCLNAVSAAGFIPVIAPLALGDDGGALNVNADSAAAEIAAATEAETAIFLTDVPGVLDAENRLIPSLTAPEVEDLIARGIISGGMIPKVEACLRAVSGAKQSQIIDGRVPHSLLGELFTHPGVGTMITRGPSHRRTYV